MAFVAFSSLYSFEDVDVPTFQIPHLDKIVHFIFYFVGAVLGLLSLGSHTKNPPAINKVVLMVLFVILFGIIIEVFQKAFTTMRSGDVLDALANTIGALIGVLVVKLLFSSKKGLNWK